MKKKFVLIAFLGLSILLGLLFCSNTKFTRAVGIDEETLNKPNTRISKNIKSWAMLRKDFAPEDVKKLLGEPERVTEGVVTTWYYQKGGNVSFIDGKVTKWVKPFSWEY